MITKRNIRHMIKYILIVFAIYYFYTAPKDHWNKDIHVGFTYKNKRHIFIPKQCLYTQYVFGWWMNKLSEKQA